jgi:hypothetical protein
MQIDIAPGIVHRLKAILKKKDFTEFSEIVLIFKRHFEFTSLAR